MSKLYIILGWHAPFRLTLRIIPLLYSSPPLPPPHNPGFGTIVGSAVFNVLFVIGLCGVFGQAKGELKLTWWPLFRDCFYYIFGLTILAVFIYDQKVEFWEAAVLFSLYLGYVTIMKFNSTLYNFINARVPWGDDKKIETSDVEMAQQDSSFPINTPQRIFSTNSSTIDTKPKPFKRRMSTAAILAEVRRAKREGNCMSETVIKKVSERTIGNGYCHHPYPPLN